MPETAWSIASVEDFLGLLLSSLTV